MPPKAKPQAAFGMKNQKGGKAQKQMQTLNLQESQKGKSKEALAKEKKKEDDKRRKAELDKQRTAELSLFSITQPKVPFGTGEYNSQELRDGRENERVEGGRESQFGERLSALRFRFKSHLDLASSHISRENDLHFIGLKK